MDGEVADYELAIAVQLQSIRIRSVVNGGNRLVMSINGGVWFGFMQDANKAKPRPRLALRIAHRRESHTADAIAPLLHASPRDGVAFSYYIRCRAYPLDSLQFPISPPEPAGDQHASFLSCSYRSALGHYRSVFARLRRPRSTSLVARLAVILYCSQPGGPGPATQTPRRAARIFDEDPRLCQPQKRRHHHLSSARRADSDALSSHQ